MPCSLLSIAVVTGLKMLGRLMTTHVRMACSRGPQLLSSHGCSQAGLKSTSVCPACVASGSWHRPGRLAGLLAWLLTRAWLRIEEKNKGCNWTILGKKRVNVRENICASLVTKEMQLNQGVPFFLFLNH